MRLLLVNDDGIDAPGLQALYRSILHAAGDKSLSITVVAPSECRSECGHGVTSKRSLVIQQTQLNWYSVNGTPVDCVRFALGKLCPEPDAVLSGINAGANLGVDLLVSGTFAAAREAAISGVPAIAISHYRRPEIAKDWDHTPMWLEPVLRDFLGNARVFQVARTVDDTTPDSAVSTAPLWNVNLPAINPKDAPRPQVMHCGVDPSPMSRSIVEVEGGYKPQSDFHGRPRLSGFDVDLCFSGHVTLSRINPFFT